MCRDEVLQYAQAFTEARFDGEVDNSTGWVGHQTTHTGHLSNLGHITFCPGGGHHVNAAQRIQGFLCGLGNFIGGLHPDPDHFIVPFIFRDETVLILTFDENRLFFGFCD